MAGTIPHDGGRVERACFNREYCQAAGSKRRNRVPIRSHSRPDSGRAAFINTGGIMPLGSFLRLFRTGFCAAALSLTAAVALAQTGAPKPSEPQKPPGDTTKDGQKSIDEIAEAARALQGPAGNPECVWLGIRVVGRLVGEDLDTAFRHLELYDRFGCPSSHVQAAFRCMARLGKIDLKAQDKVNDRIFACWLNPALPPTPPAAAAKPAAPAPAGTGNR